jgi:hypothetical protein
VTARLETDVRRWPSGNGKVPTGNAKLRSPGIGRIVHVKRWSGGTVRSVRAKLQSGEKVRSAAEALNEVEDGRMWRDEMREGTKQEGACVMPVNGTPTIGEIGPGEI